MRSPVNIAAGASKSNRTAALFPSACLGRWEFKANDWLLPTDTAAQVQGAACTRNSSPPPTHAPTAAPTYPGEAIGGKCEDTFIAMIVTPLMIGLVGGVGGGAAIILGFKYKPYHLTYAAVVVQVIMPSAVAIYLMVSSNNADVQTTAYDDDDGNASKGFTYPAYVLFGVSLLLACMYYWMRQSLKLVAELLKHSSAVLRDNMCLIPVKAVFCVGFTVMYVALVAMVVVAFMTMQVVLDQDPTDSLVLVCAPETVWDGGAQAYTGFFVVVLGWFAFWSLETRNYIVGDVAAHWYYHGQQGGDIGRATKHAFCSHFGSLAFAGLATWFIEQLKRSARSTGGNPISCLCSLLARCLLSYVEYLFKMATLMVAITGKPFGESGMDVGRLFWGSFGNMYHSTGVWFLPDRILDALSFIMSLALALAYGISQYYWTFADCKDDTLACVTGAWISNGADKDDACHDFSLLFAICGGLLVFIVMLFPLHFLCKMLTVIVDTSFLCFLMDKRDSVVTQPAFHGVFGQVLAHRSKTDAKKMEAAGKNAKPPAYLAGVPPGYSVQQAPPSYGTTPPSYHATTEA